MSLKRKASACSLGDSCDGAREREEELRLLRAEERVEDEAHEVPESEDLPLRDDRCDCRREGVLFCRWGVGVMVSVHSSSVSSQGRGPSRPLKRQRIEPSAGNGQTAERGGGGEGFSTHTTRARCAPLFMHFIESGTREEVW